MDVTLDLFTTGDHHLVGFRAPLQQPVLGQKYSKATTLSEQAQTPKPIFFFEECQSYQLYAFLVIIL